MTVLLIEVKVLVPVDDRDSAAAMANDARVVVSQLQDAALEVRDGVIFQLGSIEVAR